MNLVKKIISLRLYTSGTIWLMLIAGPSFGQYNGLLIDPSERSDERLKRNITTIEKPMELLEQLRGVTYYWRGDKHPEMNLEKDLQYGLIAQEVELVVPELVSTDSEGWKSIEYSHLTPILLEALKAQQETIQKLIGQLDAADHKTEVLKVELGNQKIELMNVIQNLQYQIGLLQREVEGVHELFAAPKQ